MHQTAIIRIRHVRQTLIQVSVGVWVWGVWCGVWMGIVRRARWF